MGTAAIRPGHFETGAVGVGVWGVLLAGVGVMGLRGGSPLRPGHLETGTDGAQVCGCKFWFVGRAGFCCGFGVQGCRL